MRNWTEQQRNAINAHDSNIIVSAAAGSGKTAVLVERVIKMITDPDKSINIDQLLIVTFTNAAAAEMKSRIADSLNSILAENSNNTNALLQLSLLPNAKICTIDSFCINLVRENFFELGISQDFTILDNSQERLLENDAINEIINRRYEEPDDSFKILIDMLSNTKNDGNLISAITQINNYIKSQPFPYIWLKNICEIYNPSIDINDTELKKSIFDDISYYLTEINDLLGLEIESLLPDDDIYDELYDIIQSDKCMVNSLNNALNGTWDDMFNAVCNINPMPMTKKRKSESKAAIVAYRNQFLDIIKKDIVPLVSVSSGDYTKDCAAIYPEIKLLCDIIVEFNEAVMEKKLEMNSFSFSDIEHFAINILFEADEKGNVVRKPPAIEYEKNFVEILVDEYQDTNKAQDTLFKYLSNGHNRFMVGDVKQSIYRFRLAMPEIFNAKKDSYADYDESSGRINQKIVLDKNFRSRLGVCEFANFLFSNLMSKRIGELEYNDEEKLNSNNDYNETDIPCASIRIVNTPEGEDKSEYEARQIAEYIIQKVKAKEQIKDKNGYRDICYGDFAVLFRSPKNKMPIYAKVFNQYGIPVLSNNRLNLFDNNEVAILLSLIRVIDNPIQDVPLLATLMSVFYGYTADEIAKAKVLYNESNLYTTICKDNETFSKFLIDLDRYRKYASSMTVESFLRQIISETSYISIISAMGNAEQRKQNVFKLIEIAKRFDSGGSVGLTAFVRYIDSAISSKLEIDSASVTHSGENSVQLMSIHQSKGLEFPVVILANAATQYNNTDLYSLVLLNSKIGIGLKIYNSDKLFRYNSAQYSYIKEQNLCASMSENLRVLYVAVTRAKEQFIVFSSYKDGTLPKHLSRLASKTVNGKILPSTVKRITNDADAILLCAMLHKDCDELRSLADVDLKPIESSSFNLDCKILDEIDIREEIPEDTAIPNETIVKEIEDRLSFTYKYSELAQMASKRNASSLDEADRGYEFFAVSKPSFLNKSGLTPAEKGTAMHNFMQYCDYFNAKDNLEEEIQRLVKDNYISVEQAKSLDRDSLSELFNSQFATRMFNSNHIYREIKVATFVPACDIENTEYTDKIMVQGIADCVFEEKGELVLVDYKTDRVDNEEQLLDRYKKQIAYYKTAIEKVLKMPVKQAMLYSFCLGKTCIYK